MTTLYITRHGETLWNVERRMQGYNDSELSELGRQQAGWLKEKLTGIPLDAVYSSPCSRAMRTAEIICNEREIEITCEQGLIEIGLGAWEGKNIDAVARLYPEQSADFWNAPTRFRPTEGGETFRQVQNRVAQAVAEIVQKHPHQNVLLVSHAVVLKTLMAFIEQTALDEYWQRPFLTQASLSVVKACNGSFRIVLANDTSHHDFIRKRDVNTW
jgi:probable phosphoglycerate mutase